MRNRAYFLLKPVVPWGIRMAVRRWHARRVWRHATAWPILPSAALPPQCWTGWPAGHSWAFVSTHDVEGPEGLSRVRRLAELEMSLGFRSTFNFIPEGPYRVPPELRTWLVANGFEVGVHDLRHDGGLYSSRSAFRKRAGRINEYLRDWGAVGFRSGFMLRELDWLHDLAISYDGSTFDVDPFEPQPEGTGTIYPFLIEPGFRPAGGCPSPGSPGSGYVELPYTLPQDSTLFLLLQQKDSALWLRKLKWLAEQGGMALVNVHPDYLRFSDEPEGPHLYPVEHYAQLLRAVRDQGPVWLPLARELAGWYQSTRPHHDGGTSAARQDCVRQAPLRNSDDPTPSPTNLRGRRVAVLLYSKYPSDSRPRRAAEALAQAGADVELICPRESPEVPTRETVAGVQVTRVFPVLRKGGTATYLLQYGCFLVSSSLVLASRAFTRRYDAVHAHNMPDFLVWAAWLPKWMGARIILDLHDPMPELFMSLYRRPREDRMIRLLTWIEQRCVSFAHLVLTPNEAFRQRFVSRSGAMGKIQVIMNSPEEEIFGSEASPEVSRTPSRTEGFRLMHHGLIAERHGLDIAIEAIAVLKDRIPDLTLDIYGERTPYLEHVLALARERGLEGRVRAHGMVTEQVIAREIGRCALGLVPNRRSPFIEINLPTRIFEYLALHCPVIVPNTHGIRDYFDDDQILYFQADDPQDLARRIQWVHDHRDEAQAIAARGHAVYRRHQWKDERVKFLGLMSRLLTPVPEPAS